MENLSIQSASPSKLFKSSAKSRLFLIFVYLNPRSLYSTMSIPGQIRPTHWETVKTADFVPIHRFLKIPSRYSLPFYTKRDKMIQNFVTKEVDYA